MNDCDNKPTENRWITEIVDAEDGSGDAILTFPPELVEEMGWKEGTILNFKLEEPGKIIITKKDLTTDENSV